MTVLVAWAFYIQGYRSSHPGTAANSLDSLLLQLKLKDVVTALRPSYWLCLFGHVRKK